MPPKKRRQENNKENLTNNKFHPISIQTILDENLKDFEAKFNQEYQRYENQIQEKLIRAQKEFDKYLQIHESQGKLAQLLDQQITSINQQQTNHFQCQQLLDKTTDLMNASSSETSRTKTYLIGELQMLPLGNDKK